MKKRLSLLFICIISIGSANASLIFHNDRSIFNGASGLTGVNDDFEAIGVAPGGVLTIADSFIGAGFSASSSGGGGMVALGSGVIGNPTTVIGSNFFSEYAIFTFLPSIEAIGVDLFSNISGDTFNINIFASSGALLGNTNVSGIGGAGTFFGVITDIGTIGRIELTGGSGELVDNITFGNVTAGSIPEPITLWLLGSGLIGLIGMRKKSSTVSIKSA